jgi:hypothetical protein
MSVGSSAPDAQIAMVARDQQARDAGRGIDYRVKLKNASWFRSVSDIRLQAIFWGRGLDPARPGTLIGVRVRTAPPERKVLRPRCNTIVTFVISEIDERMVVRLLAWGHKAAARNERTMEDLLNLGEATVGYVQVLANDGWTGGTHYRESPR